MRTKLAIATLLVVGMFAGGVALAGAAEDVSLQYYSNPFGLGDSVAVRNDGRFKVATTVTRTCNLTIQPPSIISKPLRDFRVTVGPGQVVRIDREPRGGNCSYVITAAHYVVKFGASG